ncbi:MAG: ABC transporter permease [Dissulfuribacterales bacterium]
MNALLSRLFQFGAIYTCFVGLLWLAKYGMGFSDYLIPSPTEFLHAIREDGPNYVIYSLNTLGVAVYGHIIAILLASLIAVIGSLKSTVGAVTRVAAYNLQAYPIVAVSPIIFIFLGDGLASRLLIASLICYFPLLLSLLGIFSQPVEDVEHFFVQTGSINHRLRLTIRLFENLDKLLTVLTGSATLAMVGTIVAEFLAATAGIGHAIRIALYQDNLARILLALLLIGICSSFYLAVIEILGRTFSRALQKG